MLLCNMMSSNEKQTAENPQELYTFDCMNDIILHD